MDPVAPGVDGTSPTPQTKNHKFVSTIRCKFNVYNNDYLAEIG